jgi:Protein of unknown function (DUF1553)/Protein of unknown function (DUF1549)/Planctomycete cytochrome C
VVSRRSSGRHEHTCLQICALVSIWGLFAPLAHTAAAEPKVARVEFNRDIRPILSENCYACHGPDKNRRKAQLRLDERSSALATQVIVPGKPDESELVARVQSDDVEEMMPPPSSHKKLSTQQKQLLTQWIDQGAEYQLHWAYMPPKRVEIPHCQNSSRVRNPIDAFIQSVLDSRGITPSPEAGRRTLIRRVSLDLLGLPPSPEEVRAFEHDADPRAYERLVDRLLDSPHYGERMAVAWLDLARFCDTVGYHGDQNQRIFPYRDYVIDSFNANKPFDQFTVEQLAGDLLPQPTTEQLIATGFNRLNMMTREGGAQPGEYLAKYASDRVRTVSGTWLGSTMGCAECHDHKYDPFTQRDFYSLAAFFADVKQWGVYSDYDYTPNPELRGWSNDHPFPPEIKVRSPYLARRQEQLRRQIRQACARWAAAPKEQAAFEAWLTAMRSFAAAHATGWMIPPAAPEDGGALQSDGSVLLPRSSGEETRSKRGESWTFRMKPGAGRLARIRLELLPHSAHGGKVTRGDARSASVSLSARVRAGESSGERELAFFHADADLKEPEYAGGEEVLGIDHGWRTSKDHVKDAHTGIWCLESPVDLKADDELRVVVRTDSAGCLRLSVSPFGFDPQGRPGLDDAQRAALRASAGERTCCQCEELDELYVMANGGRSPGWGDVKSLYLKMLECRNGQTFTMTTKAMPPLLTRVLPRGNWQDQTGIVVEPAVPHFLPQPNAQPGKRLTRLDLARWLVSKENPLTARAFMNRLWKQFFGTGISSLVEDLGAQGEWPVHPDLLDWLALEFRDSGWNMKRMVKLLVMSATYRQESRVRPELRDLDPNNRLLAAQSPRRLDAEFVRDNALAIAGLLNLEMGGPSVFPYQPPGYYANLQFPDRDYIADTDSRQYRRGVYMHWQRTFLHPMLANFDATPREECTPARNVANTPQQALTLLNDPTFVEAARVLAQSLLVDSGATDAQRISLAYERAVARPPRAEERDSLTAFLAAQRSFFRKHASEADQLVHVGLAPVCAAVAEPELAAWTALCRVVLALHETITRY